jgi:glycosyltransferase involved in cell wall biosynthesis
MRQCAIDPYIGSVVPVAWDVSQGRNDPSQDRKTNRKSFLCIHPSSELYGSDRTFLQSVRALRDRWPGAHITILLPSKGPLYQELSRIEGDVRVEPLFVLRRSEFGPRFLLRLPDLIRRVFKARRMMADYDVTYINTVVVLDFLLATRLSKTRALVHVHELPTGPTRIAFSLLLGIAKAAMIYISRATANGYLGLAAKPGAVIWNSTAARPDMPRQSEGGRLKLLLIGRYNAWKGQTLLLDALSLLDPAERDRLDVKLVGSVYGDQTHFLTAIEEKLAEHDLWQTVQLHGFDPKPDPYYAWANVVVVPSTEPEPFGLVAIEGMAAGRAVIAAGHGGLVEIVDDGVSGTVFAPRDARALRDAIRRYLENPSLAEAHGEAGKARFCDLFSEDRYERSIANLVQSVLQGQRVTEGAAEPL